MIQTKIEANGTEIVDYRTCRVMSSLSNFNSASTIVLLIDSPFGRHNDDFTVGETIELFADQDASPTTKLFSGIIEKIKFRGKESTQTIQITGKDFTLRLQDATVEPVVFTNSEVSTIVTNIIDNNVEDITTNNVNVTSTTLPRIAFNQETVFEALTQLADLSGFQFYVDTDKDLHFEQKANIDSGIQLDNTNILKNTFNNTREQMANSVWVYGDRYLAGFKETNRLDGSVWGGAPGSVFTLISRPHSTQIETLGSVRKGGILGLTTETVSGVDYLVNFFDKQIVFVSGTDLGYSSIPTSGGSIISTYDREIPIVKFGENKASISQFGKKVKVINDKTIRDPATAVSVLQTELEKSDPFRGMEVNVKGWFTGFNLGDTLHIVLDDFGLDDMVGIINVTYDFDKNTIQSEDVIKFRLDKKIIDLTDEITNLRRRIEAIESADRQDSDVLTRLETATGSMGIIGSDWIVRTRTTGSSFILGKGFHGVSGPTFGGILGSVIVSGINFLGDSRSEFTILASGGGA